MFSLIWIGLSQRLFLHGLKNIESLNEQSRVVIAANHRTFFDVLLPGLYIPLRIYPREFIFLYVRSFYDTIIGTINLLYGWFCYVPTNSQRKKKRIFNRYSIGRLIEEAIPPFDHRNSSRGMK